MPPPIPKQEPRVGPFVLMDEIGSGETARVFRARYRPREDDRQDIGLDYGTVVVLKVLRGNAELAPEKVEAFTREAELLVMMDHPGIARIYHAGVVDTPSSRASRENERKHGDRQQLQVLPDNCAGDEPRRSARPDVH